MRSSQRLVVRTALVMAVIVLLVVGLASGVLGRLGGAALHVAGIYRDGGSPTVNPTIFDAPAGTSTAVPAEPSAPVLPEASPVLGSTAAAIEQQVRAAGPVQGELWGMVVDAGTGARLYDNRALGAGVPASTQKVLTSLAVLDSYGPGHRFETSVRRDPADPATLYLVGGGDPYLAKGVAGGPPARSSILDLAARTAAALPPAATLPPAAMPPPGAAGGPVQIVVDTSLFSGPGWNPAWIAAYRNYAAETSALWVDGARPRGQPIGPRDADPAQVAAAAFTAELTRLGVPVGSTSRGQAPDTAMEVATVRSMPLENIVEQVLIYSDNDAAEVLFRHIGRTGGRSGSLADAQAATQETLTRLGAWTEGMEVVDGSGLARTNLTSPRALTRAVELAIADAQPKYRAIATGMSVAGTEGTLAGRFVEDGTDPGRGLVRAKTGTLTRVHSLAGYVRNADGAMLAYSFIINGEQDEYGSRVWLDRVTAALAECGCRG